MTTLVITEKRCRLCRMVKPLSEFHLHSLNKTDGRQSRCKPCAIAAAKERYHQDPERGKARSLAYKQRHPERARRYAYGPKLKRLGLTIADYDQMLAEQDARCAICRTDTPGRGRHFFCVDHDHDTGRIRGLLCMNCNDGLGRFGDNLAGLRAAVAYLERS